MRTDRFNFEDLKVWQRAIELAQSIANLVEGIKSSRKHYRLIEQLESASISISSNIAEGSGRNSKKEFLYFLFVARGSLYETLSLTVILHRNKWITANEFDIIKQSAVELCKMLSGLINSLRF